MRAENMVKDNLCPPGCERGSALLSILIAVPILLTVAFGIAQTMDNRQEHLRIVRAQNRLLMLEDKVRNAATSKLAMWRSATLSPKSTRLYNCFAKSKCYATPTSAFLFNLTNSEGDPVTGHFNINGVHCEKKPEACPIRVRTSYSIRCSSFAETFCTQPAEVVTNYVIDVPDKGTLSGRELKPIVGSVSLATFTCPKDEYITGVDASGLPICSPARLSLHGNECAEEKLATYGITPEGQFICQTLRNYCNANISLVFVVDRSGSMSSQGKMNGAKIAGLDFIDTMRDDDDVGVVSFASSSRIETTLDGNKKNNKSKSKNAIKGLDPEGTTNMTAGLNDAARIIEKAPDDDIKVIVFLSDGMHNQGPGPVPLAETLKDKGIQIWSIGFGKDVDQNTLRQLATSPSDYTFAKNPADLKKRLEEISTVMCR